LHATPHAPPWQVAVPLAGAGHTLPQLPQFCVSTDTLRHWLLQATKPVSQAKPQVPPTHVAVPCAGMPQPAPQVEQLLGSLVRSVHCPPQLVSPCAQVMVQTPEAQAWPVAQAVPQAPQFWGLEPSSTHVVPHAT
jgi:hypothetical protein